MFKCLLMAALLFGWTQKDAPIKGSHEQKQSQAKANDPQPPTPSLATSEIGKENAANAERYAYYKAHHKEYLEVAFAPAYLSNWILAGLGVVGGFLALFTLLAIKRQGDLMVDKERARIAVEVSLYDLTLEDGPEWTEGMGVVFVGSKISITNFGANNALNVRGIGAILGSNSGVLYPAGEEEIALNIPNPLKPSNNDISVDVIALLKNVNLVADVKNKIERLHLSGTVRYDDIYGNEYETRFRYVWEQEVEGIDYKRIDTSHWQKTATGNYAT